MGLSRYWKGSRAKTGSVVADADDRFPPAARPIAKPAGKSARRGGRKEVAFILSDVADYRTLVYGMRPGMEVVLLDSAGDGLSRMVDWARTRRGYHAIHVISHGAEGQLDLGSLTLDVAAAAARAVDLARLGAALKEGGELLLYGCEVAKGRGRDFITMLAAATGAAVAASDRVTGAAELGGDWLLETRRGFVGTSVAITVDAQRRYAFALAARAGEVCVRLARQVRNRPVR